MEQFPSAEGRPTISQFVKEIQYNTTNALQGNHQMYFKKLDQYFPNLHYIHTNNENTLHAIYRAILDEKFSSIKMLPLPKTVHQDKMYVSCLESRRNQLINIALFQKMMSKRDTFSILYDKLNQFPRLECIQIDIHSPTLQNVVHLLESITCGMVSKMLNQIELTLAAPATAELTKELHLVQPIPSVKNLKIRILFSDRYCACSENYMSYIMKKFPKLSNITILSRTEIYGINGVLPGQENQVFQLPPPSSKLITRFLDYLSNFSCCNIPIIVTNDEDATDLISNFHDNHSSLETCSNNYIISSSRFTVADDPDNIPRLAAIIHFKQEIFGRNRSQEICVTFQNGSVEGLTYRYMEYLLSVGRFMHNELTVQNCTVESLTQFLAQVYLHCSNIKRLHITDYRARFLMHNNQPSYFTEKSYHKDPFTEIIFTRCLLGEEVFESTNRYATALRILTLDNCFTHNQGKQKNHIIVNLPRLSLDQLNINTTSNHDKFFLRIQQCSSYKTQYINVQPYYDYTNKRVDNEFQIIVEEVEEDFCITNANKVYSIQTEQLKEIHINYKKVSARIIL